MIACATVRFYRLVLFNVIDFVQIESPYLIYY